MKTFTAALLLYVSVAGVCPAYGLIGGAIVASPPPWMSYIQLKSGEFCGASLIDRRWLLTAAHCVTNEKSLVGVGDVDAYIGVSDTTRETNFKAAVKSLHRHETYDPDPSASIHDVALVELGTSPALPDSAKPVSIFKGDPIQKALPARVLGFGTRYPFSGPKRKEISPQLRELPLTVKGWATESACPCPKYDEHVAGGTYWYDMKCDKATQVCAAGPKLTWPGEEASNMYGSACAGDSGSPLLVQDGSNEFLYGVYSYSGRVRMSKVPKGLEKSDGIIYCGGQWPGAGWSGPTLDYSISIYTAVTAKPIADWIYKVMDTDFHAAAHMSASHGNISGLSLS